MGVCREVVVKLSVLSFGQNKAILCSVYVVEHMYTGLRILWNQYRALRPSFVTQ